MKNIVIPAVLAGLMASSVSFAAELPASIKAKGEIVVAIMPNYPPTVSYTHLTLPTNREV